MVKIYKPHDRYGHKGDTFREIIDMWKDDGFVEIHESPDQYVWWNEPGDVLLHDHPVIMGVPKCNQALFGNEQCIDMKSWVFWGRNPRMLETVYKTSVKVNPKYRMWESIFIGKVENSTQMNNRFQSKIDWTKHIQNFMIVKGVNAPYPYSPADYLYNMSISKFALLLPGYGPKCNRDIEACAMGAVPIVTPGVCTEYYDKWEEGRNYLRLETENNIEKIFNTPNEILEEIQETNYEWYENNSTSKGSFHMTRDIIADE